MNLTLKEYQQRFEVLTLRERLLVITATLATIITIGYTAFIEPQIVRLKGAEAQHIQKRNELNDIQEKINFTETTANNQATDNLAALTRINEQIAGINDQLTKISLALVPPDNVPTLLKEILKRNSRVDLVSLRNLPSTPIAEHNRSDDKKTNEASAGNTQTNKASNENTKPDPLTAPLFKHSVEIAVTGSYSDLLAYLTDLEKMPQRLLWNSMELKVESYPRSKMTIVVYTLSFDKTWLTL